jgi:chorismate lyase/3-hydroxybenzoate synthase
MRVDSMRLASTDAPPRWVGVALGECEIVRIAEGRRHLMMQIAEGRRFALLTAAIRDAADLGEDELRRQVHDAYDLVLSTLDARRQHALRFWNFIPSLHASLGPGRDRYMVFNSGRFLAYSGRAATAESLARIVPTASGVGSTSSALTIHCFAGPEAGRPVEHARQIPAYRYSRKYGPNPPCFARATLVDLPDDSRGRLLVGGTASVRGEDSVHTAIVDLQVDETLVNLASIVEAASTAHDGGSGDRRSAANPESLARFTDLRVYLPRLEDEDRVLARLAPAFPGVHEIEIVKADLCRRELRVEVEGVATIGRRRV